MKTHHITDIHYIIDDRTERVQVDMTMTDKEMKAYVKDEKIKLPARYPELYIPGKQNKLDVCLFYVTN